MKACLSKRSMCLCSDITWCVSEEIDGRDVDSWAFVNRISDNAVQEKTLVSSASSRLMIPTSLPSEFNSKIVTIFKYCKDSVLLQKQ